MKYTVILDSNNGSEELEIGVIETDDKTNSVVIRTHHKEKDNNISIIKRMYSKYWETDCVIYNFSGCYAFLDETEATTAWNKCDIKGFINWKDLVFNMIENLTETLSYMENKESIKTQKRDIKLLESI